MSGDDTSRAVSERFTELARSVQLQALAERMAALGYTSITVHGTIAGENGANPRSYRLTLEIRPCL